MDSNKDNAGDRIHPETSPQHRRESLDSRQLYCRCEAEDSKVHARTDAHHKSHSDGVHKQNAGVGKQRIRFAYPLAEAALFNVKQKLRHIATQNITNGAGIHSPRRGGVDATSTKYREASFKGRTGWSVRRNIGSGLTTPSAPSL